MTTTDTDALTERMAAEMYYSDHPEGRHRNEWPGSVYPDTVYEYRDLAAAVLPIIAATEHRIARLEAQTDVRGRAVVMYRERAREAEARIKAVRELVDQDGADRWWVQEWGRHAIPIADIRRALEG